MNRIVNEIGQTSSNGPASTERGWLRQALTTIWDIFQQRCPRCRKGRIFRGRFAMNDPCPVCELVFQREEGYFLGAMYVSYGISTVILTITYVIAALVLPPWHSALIALIVVLPLLPLLPAIFRYSRVIWIYFERAVCPGNISAGPFEKSKQKQHADSKLTLPRSQSNGSHK